MAMHSGIWRMIGIAPYSGPDCDAPPWGGSSAETLANDPGYEEFCRAEIERNDPEAYAAAQWPAPPWADEER